MNIFVHLMIAKSVRRSVYDQVGVKLNRFGFLYGSIQPDLSAKYQNIPHFMAQSFNFVLDKARELCSLDENAVGSSVYALRLGVICHYLSDFFCYAHSERYTGGICRHHLYELSMLFSFRKALQLFNRCPCIVDIEAGSLRAYVRQAAEQYGGAKGDTALDACYAMRVCAAVTICLIRQTMIREAEQIFRPAVLPQYYLSGGELG